LQNWLKTPPGQYLLVEVAKHRALMPSVRVRELLRLLECRPLPNAPAHIAGSFLWRGTSVVTVDLATCLGVTRVPALDAHLMVLASSPTVALVVDRVHSVVDAPLLAEGSAETVTGVWDAAGLVSGLCRVEQELLPLLNPSRLVHEVEGLFE